MILRMVTVTVIVIVMVAERTLTNLKTVSLTKMELPRLARANK